MYKRFNKLFEQSAAQYCQSDLFDLFLLLSYKSSFAYISALCVFIWLFYDVIPLNILLPILSIHLLYQIIRFYLVYRYKDKEFNVKRKERFRLQHTVLMFVGGVAWGTLSFLAVVYAPTPYEYIVLALIIAMSAGSISTLSPLYRTYAAFNLPMIFLLMFAFMYQGDEIHFYIALGLPIFLFTVMSASWDMHKSLKRSIELKELFFQAQDELSEINMSLEDRIRKEVERNRQKDRQMLEQSRLAQMGEMISMIAHQWRQPLSAISAVTGSMSLHMQLQEYDEKYMQANIDKINSFTQHLSNTVTDFRSFFKPDKEKSLTSLDDIVVGSLNIVRTSLEVENIEIDTFLDSKKEFMSFPNELKQVVLNILKNAQDVFIEEEIKEPRITIKSLTRDDEVQLSISDNAGGISEENIRYIFDPYFTTKEELDGTGLGMYMSKMIVEDHCNGKLLVENKDNGACFNLILPCN